MIFLDFLDFLDRPSSDDDCPYERHTEGKTEALVTT